jgi:hypothetical protein
MLELSDELFEVKFKGVVSKLRYPTIKDAKILREKIKSVAEDEAMIDFISSLGMDKELAEELTSQHILSIMEALNSKKK